MDANGHTELTLQLGGRRLTEVGGQFSVRAQQLGGARGES